MTSDVTAGASGVSRLGAGAAVAGRAKQAARRGEGGRLIIAGVLPDHRSMIASGAGRHRSVAVGRDSVLNGST